MEKLPILVGYIQSLGAGFAHVAQNKGTQDLVPIQSLLKWVANLGLNGDIILRTDPEMSIKALRSHCCSEESTSTNYRGGDAGEQSEFERRS